VVALFSVALAGGIPGGAIAKTRPVYWTPAKMVDALISLDYPPYTLGALCAGLGVSHSGTFAAFRCTGDWQKIGTGGSSTQSGHYVAWAKPLPGGVVCASMTRLSLCQKIGAFNGVLCAKYQPVSCMYQASTRAIATKLETLISGNVTITGIEFPPCTAMGPTSSPPTSRTVMDCDFIAHGRTASRATPDWDGHVVIHYVPVGAGYRIRSVTITGLKCYPDTQGQGC